MRQLELEDAFYKKRKYELIREDILPLVQGLEEKDREVIAASTEWVNMPIVACAAQIARLFDKDYPKGVCKAVEAILRLSEKGLYTLTKTKANLVCDTRIKLSKETKTKLRRLRYLPPMVSKPNPVRKNNDSAYYTVRDTLILGDSFNYHEGNISLDIINIQNSIKLSYVGEPNEVSEMMPEYFYMAHKVDKRGRLYCCGYEINYQGTDEQKASVAFYEKEVIHD